MTPHRDNNNIIMNAFSAMEEEERKQQQQQQQQQEACFMFSGNNTSNGRNIHPHGISHNNYNNASNAADHASLLDSAVSPLQAFLRHQDGQVRGGGRGEEGRQVQRYQSLQQEVLFDGGGTSRDDNDVTSRAWNPFHHVGDDDDDDDDDDEDRPLPIDSDHTDINDIRDAVDVALAHIGGDCDDSLVDLDDVEEFFADIVEEQNSTARNVKEATGDNHDSMTSIEFAILAGSFAVTEYQHQQQQQEFQPVSIIEGMEVLENSDGGFPPNNNGNMDYSSRNMGDSGRGSLASLGSLTGAFSKLNHCMQQTAHTREMIQQLSSPNLHSDVFRDDGSNHHNNSCNSLSIPNSNQSFHSLQSLGRSQRGRPTKSLKRLTKSDLLGRSSSMRSLGSANSGGVRKAPSKATLSTSSTTSLRSIGSTSTSSKRRKSTHLGGQRYKKRSSNNSLSTMRKSENPLVTGIAPINWDGI